MNPKQRRKTILTAPISALHALKNYVTKDTIDSVNTLHDVYLSQKRLHDQLQVEMKVLSRKIGETKRKKYPTDKLIQDMKLKGELLSTVGKRLKEAEQQLLSYFDLEAEYQPNDALNNYLSVQARFGGNGRSSSDTSVTIGLLNSEESEWNHYVESHPTASIYHRTEWRDLIKKNFGHQSHYLLAKDSDERIVGILPLVRLKSIIFGDFLISMPYFNYGGPLANQPDIEQRLIKSANELASSLSVDHIEYRDDISRSGMPALTNKVNMILHLPSTPSELWHKIGSKLRAQIKRPQRENPKIEIGGADLVDDFYTVFARNMRDLGTPVYAKSFFQDILQSFPAASRIIIVRLQNQPVSAGFLLGHKDTLEIPWASTTRDVNHLSMNMLLYWEVLKFAIESDYRFFDFGRSSKQSGTFRFKQQWGAKPKQLYWHYWLANGVELPRLNPDNPKYTLAINLWKRLPVFITKWLGPHIVRNLP